MGLILGSSQTLHIGYPIALFYLVAVIGGVLIVVRPWWAFLFAVFCLSARDFHAAVFTRTALFGPYLNLNDLLLWICLLAMLKECFGTRKLIWIPQILLAIFGLIVIGDIQSLYKYGFTGDVFRRIWSTAIFPIMFLISANMVQSDMRARSFYLIFFLGTVTAALQHIFYVHMQTYDLLLPAMHQFRTISYSASGGSYILIAAMFLQRHNKLGKLKNLFYYFGLSLIGLSILLASTRGSWIVIGVVIPILFLMLRKYQNIPRLGFRIGVLFVGLILIVQVLLPNLGLGKSLVKRFETLQQPSTAYSSRWEGARTEIDIWLNSSLILGSGSTLPLEYESADKEVTGALYHVGITTYLTHYGLLGIIIYVILLPLSTFKVGRRYYLKHFMYPGGRLVLVSIACIIATTIGSLSSMHFLLATCHIPGLLYGVVWGLSKGKRIELKRICLKNPVYGSIRRPLQDHMNI